MSVQYEVSGYETLVFDCDGVILNSNKIKTQAFYQVALPYGEAAAQALLEYHVTHGGVSRYKKFAYFLESIVPEHASFIVEPSLKKLLSNYAESVQQSLLTCDIASGLYELRELTAHTKWLIVSGGDQVELNGVFAQRNLSTLFDGGIFGSPDNKDYILERELNNGNIQQPALFLGDSKYDYEAACKAGIDFVFLNAWSEVREHQKWCEKNEILSLESIQSLVRKQSF